MKLQYVQLSRRYPTIAEMRAAIDVDTFDQALIQTYFKAGYTPPEQELFDVKDGWTEKPQFFINSSSDDMLEYFFKVS